MNKAFDLIVIMLTSALLILLRLTPASNDKHALKEVAWIQRTLLTILLFWLSVSLLQQIQSRSYLSVLSLTYSTIYMLTFISAFASIVYSSYQALFQMEDNMNPSAERVLIHELFMVLRFMSIALALLQAVSVYFYLRLHYSTNDSEVVVKRRIATESEESGDEDRDRKLLIAIKHESATPGYLFGRLPYSVPFRRLVYEEDRQCALCLEKPKEKEMIITEKRCRLEV